MHLLVAPEGGRYWRYAYRFAGKAKLLSLGIYPDVPLELARDRRRFARHLLDMGQDPSELKRALGRDGFVVAARKWLEHEDIPLSPRLWKSGLRAIGPLE